MPQKLTAKLVMVTVPSNNVAQSRDFYQKLLGIDLVRNLDATAESYHSPLSQDGIDLQVGPRRNPQETPTFYFHVDDLDASLRQLGGNVVFGPQPIAMTDQAFQLYDQAYRQAEPGGPNPTKQLGRMAVVQEPGGAAIGLIQLDQHVHKHFQAGSDQKPLADWQERHRTLAIANARKMFGGP